MDILELASTALQQKEQQENKPCEGKVYRAHLNAFINSKGEYVEQKRMTPMKRMSCPGCEKCDWLLEDLREQIISTDMSPIVTTLVNKAFYRLVVANITKDWESGIVDGWDIVFERVKK